MLKARLKETRDDLNSYGNITQSYKEHLIKVKVTRRIHPT